MDYNPEEIFSSTSELIELFGNKEYASRSFESKLRSEVICGIYKISNNINKKIYIGSSEDIRTRWKSGHCRDLMKNDHHSAPLQNFFNKKDYEHIRFTIECIEECPENHLKDREQFYLDDLSPFNDNGYNVCRIAYSSKGLRRTPKMIADLSQKLGSPLNQYTLDGNFIQSYNSPYIAFQNTGLNNRSIAGAAFRSKNGLFGGFIWRPLNNEFSNKDLTSEQLKNLRCRKKYKSRSAEDSEKQSSNFGRKVAKYDLNGTLIAIYNSMYLAASENNLKKDSIRACCRGKQKSGIHAGFKWEWASEKTGFTCKKVGRFSKDWELIETFSSMKEAEATGLYKAITISDACRGKIKSYRGFNWKYIE